MFSKIKIWHFLASLFILILLLRFNFIIEMIALLYSYMHLLFYNSKAALGQLDFSLVDYFLSLFVFILVPLLIVIFRKKLKFLYHSISLLYAVLILLSSFAILSPILSPSNPQFHNNISVSKLLPPFSTKTLLILHPTSDSVKNEAGNFINDRNLLKPIVQSENVLVADSIKISDSIILYQKDRAHKIYYNETNLLGKEILLRKLHFILGTDEFGRDIFSRLIYGTRLSVLIGLGSVVVALVLGLVLGFISGYSGRVTDTILNRMSEMFLAFPMIFFIILVIALFGNSIVVIVLILGFSGWMSLFKIVRGEVISLKNKDFVLTAELMGLSKTHILFKEILPLMLSPIIVNLVLQFSNVIIAESALSYLGLGLGGRYASWGAMIEAGQYYLSQAWWMSFFPCLFLFITLLTINGVGKKMESIIDPRIRE